MQGTNNSNLSLRQIGNRDGGRREKKVRYTFQRIYNSSKPQKFMEYYFQKKSMNLSHGWLIYQNLFIEA